MKILMVSWSTLPNKGGSSIIVENLARNFSKDELYVLGSREYFQKALPKRNPKYSKFDYFFSEFYFMGRGYRYFGWLRKLRFKPLVNYIKKIINTEKIDHVIGVYPNDYYCHAACLAAKELNIPFSAYFHNTYVENKAITDPRAQEIQDEIFDSAINIFVMSKGMQKYYEEKYQMDKFIPLVHTFNEYPNQKIKTGIAPTLKGRYKLVAIGNFNESNLEASRRFINAIKDRPEYSLSIYTHVPKILLRNRGIDIDAIEYKGFIDPDDIHEALQGYDACILTHGFKGGYGEVEYKTIFPTRTIPFLLSGKPIFAHSPKGSFLNDFIEEHQCAELIDVPSEKAILEGLSRVCENDSRRRELVSASEKTAQLFYGPNVIKQLKHILQQTSTARV